MLDRVRVTIILFCIFKFCIMISHGTRHMGATAPLGDFSLMRVRVRESESESESEGERDRGAEIVRCGQIDTRKNGNVRERVALAVYKNILLEPQKGKDMYRHMIPPVVSCFVRCKRSP